MDRMVNEKSANNQITPEEAYECRETSMLLHELIDELPEEQRQCILLYYMEEYSIKDIAGVCKCSENTIKSRLNYGKKKLEEKTIELQKKGYVLRGVTPVYLITWLLKTDMGYKLSFVYGRAATSAFSHTLFTKLVNAGIVTAVNSGLTNAVGSGMNNTVQSGMTNMVNSGMTTAAGETISGGTATVAEGTAAVNGGTAVAGTAAKGVASTAVKGGIHTLAGKIITGALVTVIAGGLVTAGVVTIINNNKTENEVTTEATTEEITTEVTTTEATTELTTEVTTEEVTEEEDPDAYYEEVYSVVIENNINLINEWLPNFDGDMTSGYENYEYSLADAIVNLGRPSLSELGYWINDIDGDGVPELIIARLDDGLIYGMFTIIDDEITFICASSYRYSYYYNGDNKFVYIGSWSWCNSALLIYELNSNELEFVEGVMTSAKDVNNTDGGLVYYFTTDYNCYESWLSDYSDVSSATEISESEFNAKKAEYIDENYTFTDLTPLSEY